MSVDDRFDPETADLEAVYARELPSGHLEDETWERLADDRLSTTERAAALDHIVACRACADVHRGLQAFEREATAIEPGARPARIRPSLVPVWSQALAATLVLALAGWVTLRQGPPPERISPAIPATPSVPSPGRSIEKPEVQIGAEHFLSLRGRDAPDPAYLKQLQDALGGYRADRFEEASRALARLAESRPDAAEPPLYQGISLLLLGRAQEAVAPLERATRLAGADLSDIAEFHLAIARRDSGEARARESLARLCEREGPYKGQACRALESAPR